MRRNRQDGGRQVVVIPEAAEGSKRKKKTEKTPATQDADTLMVDSVRLDTARLQALRDQLGIGKPRKEVAEDVMDADDIKHWTDSIVKAHSYGYDENGYIIDAAEMERRKAEADSLARATMPQPAAVTFVPDPKRALWLSLVFPGAGQVYNHRYWKLPIIYGGFLGCVYALSWNNQMLRDYSQAYLDIMDDDPNTHSYMGMLPMGYDITGREERFKEIFKNKKNYYRKYRDMSIFAFAGVYLISVIDAYVDAELSTFDISRDLSLKLEPAVMGIDSPLAHRYTQKMGLGLQCTLNF